MRYLLALTAALALGACADNGRSANDEGPWRSIAAVVGPAMARTAETRQAYAQPYYQPIYVVPVRQGPLTAPIVPGQPPQW